MKELAAFASSDYGKTFARVEQHFGRDPAAFLEDDVLAHNLRAAFVVMLHRDEQEPAEDAVEHTRRAGQEIRRRMSG